MDFIYKIFGYRRLAGLAGALFAGAVLDLAGIALLFPYIELAASPERFIEKFDANGCLEALNIQNHFQLLLLAGAALILFYTIKVGIVYLLNRYQFRAVADMTYRLSEAMYERVLRCRYNAFQQFPASQLVGVVYNNPIHAGICITSIATIVNDTLFLVMLLIIVVWLSPLFALVGLAVIALISAALYATVVRRTQRCGRQQALVEDEKHKLAFATISAIKDIKVMGIEDRLLRENAAISKQYYSTTWQFNLLGSLPKAAIEYLFLLAMTIGILVLVATREDAVMQLPLIGAAIAAAIRTLPSFNRLITAFSTFRFYRPFIAKIIDFYDKTAAFEVCVTERHLKFERCFELRNLSFSYGDKSVLEDVSISIPKGQSVGIVGMSGAGKSTLLDLISGIQEKKGGEFLLDGEQADPFGTNAIRRMLGYVPQAIALVDDSIAFNIAFSHDWNEARLGNVLKVANLTEFVDQLPEQERTRVGENGIRLSGGQRQRIGIARALYKDPEILIFDEATSAVDNITERELTEEVGRLSGAKTLIIVAHRLSTIRKCDRIYVLHHGKNAGAGTYEELLQGNELFQQMHRQQAGVGSEEGGMQ